MVEARFRERVKEAGGMAVKLMPTKAGLPDRMALLPGGRIIFVELKAPGRTAEAHQLVVHSYLRRLGFRVDVLDTSPKVDEWAAANL